jgi:hypothetical protein
VAIDPKMSMCGGVGSRAGLGYAAKKSHFIIQEVNALVLGAASELRKRTGLR